MNWITIGYSRASNKLLVYYVSKLMIFLRFEAKNTQYEKLKNGTFQLVTPKIIAYNDTVIKVGRAVVLHVQWKIISPILICKNTEKD